jgi:hypothetical protein
MDWTNTFSAIGSQEAITMHHYSVQLRITGETLKPDEISALLNLQPNHIRIRGQKGGRNRIWSESLWSYDGDEGETQKEWPSLEEGLMCLLGKLWSKKELITSLSSTFEAVWWCGHFQTSFDGGPTFSTDLLSKLAEFKVPLFLDNYFSADEEGDGKNGSQAGEK